MDRLIEWLPETIPPQHESSVVHGDYRLDNLIFEKDANRVLAVLDWELSTLGDPVADFAYLMLNWHNPADGRAGLLGLDLEKEQDLLWIAREGLKAPLPENWKPW